MPADWKNQKTRKAEPSEMIAVRVPSILKQRTQATTEAGNSTLAAAVRWGLEKFNETFGEKPAEPPKSDLFE